jgi:hypothetical protein
MIHLRRLRQEDLKFKASLVYIVRPYLRKKDIQRANKHMRTHSIPYLIDELQIISMRYHSYFCTH